MDIPSPKLAKKALIIELNDYHEECLYSQIKFLKEEGYTLGLIIHPCFKKAVKDYAIGLEWLSTVEVNSKIFFILRIFRLIVLYKKIKKFNPTTIIFNTASSKKEIIALSFLFRTKKLVGILHNLKKLKSSFSQRLISKNVKHYFVLNDILAGHAVKISPILNFCSFYPVYFPSYNQAQLKKDSSEIWITIPGKIESSRRDYFFVLEIIKRLASLEKIKFILLGRLDSKNEEHELLKKTIKRENLNPTIITFDQFIPNQLFHSYLKNSDFMLIPIKEKDTKYTKDKVMGVFNLAFAYNKTLIAPFSLKSVKDIADNGLFYKSKEDLINLFHTIDMENGSTKNNDPNHKFSFSHQKNKYISFIEQIQAAK